MEFAFVLIARNFAVDRSELLVNALYIRMAFGGKLGAITSKHNIPRKDVVWGGGGVF